MKRGLTSIITFIFVGFLLISLFGIVQNVIQDVHKNIFGTSTTKNHILAYEKV